MTDPAAGRAGRQRSRRWWIAVLFAIGSSLFAVGAVPSYSEAAGLRATALTFFFGSLFFSAVASYVVPATGDVWNAELSNLGTLVGALCFLVGALMLLPTGTTTEPEISRAR